MQQKQRRARAMDLVAVANATRLDMPLLDLGHNHLPMLFFREDGPADWDPTIADDFFSGTVFLPRESGRWLGRQANLEPGIVARSDPHQASTLAAKSR